MEDEQNQQSRVTRHSPFSSNSSQSALDPGLGANMHTSLLKYASDEVGTSGLINDLLDLLVDMKLPRGQRYTPSGEDTGPGMGAYM